MSDNENTSGEGGSEFKAITSQADLDRILGDRLARERAKFADYDEVKAKAAEFDKVSEASKSEIQKALDRAAAAEKEAEGYRQREQVQKWARDIVKGSSIPADVLRGGTEEELRAHFEQLKALAPAAPRRTAVPAGKADAGGGESRAAAALRQLRRG